MNFKEKVPVQESSKEKLLLLCDELFENYSAGFYLNLQIDEKSTSFIEADKNYYLIINRFITKGKNKIDNRKVYLLSSRELSSLFSEYESKLYGDRVQWLIIREDLSIEQTMYIDGSFRLFHKKETTKELGNYTTKWIRSVLGNLPFTVENLEQSLRAITHDFRVVDNSSFTSPTLQSIIKKESHMMITTWINQKNAKNLVSVSFLNF